MHHLNNAEIPIVRSRGRNSRWGIAPRDFRLRTAVAGLRTAARWGQGPPPGTAVTECRLLAPAPGRAHREAGNEPSERTRRLPSARSGCFEAPPTFLAA